VVGPRRPIAVLPAALSERIAAGEAIERPAAAVKELLENALDTGAVDVDIEVAGGGLTLIRVADNGRGIPSAEMELAFQRHATSKVASDADLEEVASLGFRGEALASLAAVADVTMISATGDEPTGWQVSYAGGQCVHRGPMARRRGATIAVRQLFARLPGRRKFMGAAAGETARIAQVVRRYAVVHPQVSMALTADKRPLLRTTGSGQVDAAVGECWGNSVRHGMLRIERVERSGFSIGGWIGDRATTRPTRAGIILAVNGRPVTMPSLLEGLEAAYRPLLPRGRHPWAVLCIACAPGDVDANIHPAKAEVLLRRGGEIAQCLAQACRAALASLPDRPRETPWAVGLAQGVLPLAPAMAPGLRERRGRYQTAEERAAEARRTLTELPGMRLLGQVHQSLILLEGTAGFYLVDQHRAHERILYERLTTGPSAVTAQTLIEPVVLEIKPHDAKRFQARLAQLEALGFHVEHANGLTFLVHTVPTVEGSAEALLPSEGSDEVWQEATLPGDNWLSRLRTAVACRTALRRGTPLPVTVMHQLLYDLAALQAPAVCPHGSPLILEVTTSFLARQFDWR